MKDEGCFGLGIFLGFIMGFGLCMFTVVTIREPNVKEKWEKELRATWNQELVEMDLGYYHPKTKEFTWNVLEKGE